jgi:hypothetical protein
MRLAERLGAVGFDQDLGQGGEHADVLVTAGRDGDAEVDGLAVPVDAVGKLEEPQRRAADENPGLVGPVGDRDALAHVGGNLALAFQDRGRVTLIDGSELLEQGARLAQRIPLVGGVLGQSDRLTD